VIRHHGRQVRSIVSHSLRPQEPMWSDNWEFDMECCDRLWLDRSIEQTGGVSESEPPCCGSRLVDAHPGLNQSGQGRLGSSDLGSRGPHYWPPLGVARRAMVFGSSRCLDHEIVHLKRMSCSWVQCDRHEEGSSTAAGSSMSSNRWWKVDWLGHRR